MKAELEQADIKLIAKEIAEMLKPLLVNNGKSEEDIIFDVPKLAKYLNVSTKWVYERTQFKEIPHRKIKGLLRFRKKDIDKWIDSHNVPSVDTLERISRIAKRTRP